ncbi:MAG: dihydrodipicolinate synthase family protein [Gemmatimonadetes bacterium]|nr:dihydrodipicolinate synthase family protein [Gemmatimonadota bacterium]
MVGTDSHAAESRLRAHLLAGEVIPAHPLALTAARRLDERRQRALTRYYLASGAGGLAVGVHTTQFAIRAHGLLPPVLELAAEAVRTGGATLADGTGAVASASTVTRSAPAVAPHHPCVLVAGAVGDTPQAVSEARLAADLGYDAVLLSLGALHDAADAVLLAHCRAVAEVLPLFGFYLQPAVGGRVLSHAFWRALAELPRLVAIKVAPFDRYRTLDVVRAIGESGRDDVALYTGNDDNIVLDLLTPVPTGGGTRRIVGGLLGQWAVWTSRAVELLRDVRAMGRAPVADAAWLARAAALTDANAAIFDAAHGFAGCIAGIHEVLRRQGLLAGTWCLDEREQLSPGQAREIDRVCRAHPQLADDAFVARHLDDWMR